MFSAKPCIGLTGCGFGLVPVQAAFAKCSFVGALFEGGMC